MPATGRGRKDPSVNRHPNIHAVADVRFARHQPRRRRSSHPYWHSWRRTVLSVRCLIARYFADTGWEPATVCDEIAAIEFVDHVADLRSRQAARAEVHEPYCCRRPI